MFVLSWILSVTLSTARAESLVLGGRVVIDRVTVRHAPRGTNYSAHEKKYFISIEEPVARAFIEKLLERRADAGALPRAVAVLTLDDTDFAKVPQRRGPHHEGPMFMGVGGRLHLEIGRWWQRKIATAEIPLLFFGHRAIEDDHFDSAVLTEVDDVRAFEFKENYIRFARLFERFASGSEACARRLGGASQSGARK